MSKITNVFLLLQYLENGRKYSISELAEKLEVSERMVRFYKDELEKAGIYIDTIMGPYGGYVLNQRIPLPSKRITKEDYEFLHSLKVSSEQQEAKDNLTQKLLSICLEYPHETVEVEDQEKGTYNLLARAIKEKRKVKIIYTSLTNGNQERVIHPLNLFFYEDGWSCSAFCELKSDLRNFKFKRIQSIELLEEKF